MSREELRDMLRFAEAVGWLFAGLGSIVLTFVTLARATTLTDGGAALGYCAFAQWCVKYAYERITATPSKESSRVE